jgi:hypothetical protein
MTIPGQPPVQIVCCGTCSTAIAVGDPTRVVAGERSEQLKLKAAIKSPPASAAVRSNWIESQVCPDQLLQATDPGRITPFGGSLYFAVRRTHACADSHAAAGWFQARAAGIAAASAMNIWETIRRRCGRHV